MQNKQEAKTSAKNKVANFIGALWVCCQKRCFSTEEKNGQFAADARNNLQDALNSMWVNRERVVPEMMHLKWALVVGNIFTSCLCWTTIILLHYTFLSDGGRKGGRQGGRVAVIGPWQTIADSSTSPPAYPLAPLEAVNLCPGLRSLFGYWNFLATRFIWSWKCWAVFTGLSFGKGKYPRAGVATGHQLLCACSSRSQAFPGHMLDKHLNHQI